MVFREWLWRCRPCEKIFGEWRWDYDLMDVSCPACGEMGEPYVPERGKAPGIATDDIPGGIEVRHLSRHPQRFYSKTEIKRACNERGFNFADDTPKPYNVRWSGKRRNEPKADNTTK